MWSGACSRAAGPCEKAGGGQTAHSLAEVNGEMKAIIILTGLVAVAAAARAAQPVTPATVASVTTYASEPVWMILCGASLLAIASVVRRYLP